MNGNHQSSYKEYEVKITGTVSSNVPKLNEEYYSIIRCLEQRKVGFQIYLK